MIEQVTGAPFNQNAQNVVKIDEDYTANRGDDVIDAFDNGNTITLPANPFVGQVHRVLAVSNNQVVDGNGHSIGGGADSVLQDTSVDYTFAHTNVWIAGCCPFNNGG